MREVKDTVGEYAPLHKFRKLDERNTSNRYRARSGEGAGSEDGSNIGGLDGDADRFAGDPATGDSRAVTPGIVFIMNGRTGR
jgi:hypothetical protein